ncbi:MAG: 4Fe-4S dicluster domain-containing protein [Desulfatiglans sp.]|jgi:heterodisulfide reductase subunit C|nr:4Fe-4S dicluster domain-containing protein [Thermodesulfobacteriota bacterium]MEE4351486.1 4Fe-4S dicluster domain-containing protein [Desulfatiglans sp.]
MTIKLSTKTVEKDFIKKLREVSGQNIFTCMQCGMCTGSCPMTEQIDASPRRIMRMVQYGLEEKICEYKTFWTCASCYNCSVNCPRGIDIARVMESLRLLMLRRNTDYVTICELPKETVEEMPQIALVSGFRKMTS